MNFLETSKITVEKQENVCETHLGIYKPFILSFTKCYTSIDICWLLLCLWVLQAKVAHSEKQQLEAEIMQTETRQS